MSKQEQSHLLKDHSNTEVMREESNGDKTFYVCFNKNYIINKVHFC